MDSRPASSVFEPYSSFSSVPHSKSVFRVPSRRDGRGFSLLELIAVLAVFSLILGMAAFPVADLLRQQAFEEPVASLKQMARQAAGLASSRNRRHVIRLEPSGATLVRSGAAAPIDQVQFPASVRFSIRPWGGSTFMEPEAYDWIFDASGLCEPIRVRFEENDSFFEVEFHPLGAGVREERMLMESESG